MLVPRPVDGLIANRLADTIVGNSQLPVVSFDAIRHHDSAGVRFGREGMLEGVDHQFGHDKPHVHRYRGGHSAGIGLHVDRDPRRITDDRCSQVLAKLAQIGGELKVVAPARGLELLLHGGYGQDSPVGVFQMHARLVGMHFACVESQNARDDLQAIADTVLHFAQEGFVKQRCDLCGGVLLASCQDFRQLPRRRNRKRRGP